MMIINASFLCSILPTANESALVSVLVHVAFGYMVLYCKTCPVIIAVPECNIAIEYPVRHFVVIVYERRVVRDMIESE